FIQHRADFRAHPQVRSLPERTKRIRIRVSRRTRHPLAISPSLRVVNHASCRQFRWLYQRHIAIRTNRKPPPVFSLALWTNHLDPQFTRRLFIEDFRAFYVRVKSLEDGPFTSDVNSLGWRRQFNQWIRRLPISELLRHGKRV